MEPADAAADISDALLRMATAISACFRTLFFISSASFRRPTVGQRQGRLMGSLLTVEALGFDHNNGPRRLVLRPFEPAVTLLQLGLGRSVPFQNRHAKALAITTSRFADYGTSWDVQPSTRQISVLATRSLTTTTKPVSDGAL